MAEFDIKKYYEENKKHDAGNGMHSFIRTRTNGVNVCGKCNGDPRICGHFNDARDYYGPFDRANKPNWMSPELFKESAQWCAEHIDQITWTLKRQYPDGSAGTIPFLRNMLEKE
jgi:hypothetical protein